MQGLQMTSHDQSQQQAFKHTELLTVNTNKIICIKAKTKLTSCTRGDTICLRLLYAGRCGPAAAHPLCLRRPARLASNSCGHYEY